MSFQPLHAVQTFGQSASLTNSDADGKIKEVEFNTFSVCHLQPESIYIDDNQQRNEGCSLKSHIDKWFQEVDLSERETDGNWTLRTKGESHEVATRKTTKAEIHLAQIFLAEKLKSTDNSATVHLPSSPTKIVKIDISGSKEQHPYWHSSCCVGGCVPVGVFGSFATPLIPTALDGMALVSIGKYLAGAAVGSASGILVGYGIYKLYYRVYPRIEVSNRIDNFFEPNDESAPLLASS